MVATSLQNLAEVEIAQGRYSDAEKLCERALAIAEKSLGTDHPDVALILADLATIYRETERPDQAAVAEARAEAIRAATP
jgi:tetratricopeptide (TPR) repeat protein